MAYTSDDEATSEEQLAFRSLLAQVRTELDADRGIRRFHSGAWEFFCARRPTAPMLVLGPAEEMDTLLNRFPGATAVRHSGLGSAAEDGRSWVDVTAHGQVAVDASRYRTVVVHNAARTAHVLFPTSGFGAISRLCDEIARLLEPGGEFVLTFQLDRIWSHLPYLTHGSATFGHVLGAVRRADLSVTTCLRLRDAISGTGLYKVEPVGPQHSPAARLRLLTARAFGVVGARQPATISATRLGRIVATAEGREGSAEPSIYLGSFGVYVAVAGSSVIKIPSTPEAAQRCARNREVIEGLIRLSLPFDTPRPLAAGHHDGIDYFAESRVAGTSVEAARVSRRRRQRLAASARASLERAHAATLQRKNLTYPLFERLFAAPVELLAGGAPAQTMDKLRVFLRHSWQSLDGRSMPLVLVHGDFKCGNILWTDDDRVSGVIDWDMADLQGLPLLDQFTYAAWDSWAEERISPAASFAAAVQPSSTGAHLRFVRDVLQLDEFSQMCCALMTLVRYAGQHRQFPSYSRWYDCIVGRHLDVAVETLLANPAKRRT
jgi:aminoglycoside phosphotransferase (APT) family kinase protein